MFYGAIRRHISTNAFQPARYQHHGGTFAIESCISLQGYIEEYRHQQKIASMPDSKKYRLYALRIMMNILTVGIIFACGTAIYFAQQFSTEVNYILSIFCLRMPLFLWLLYFVTYASKLNLLISFRLFIQYSLQDTAYCMLQLTVLWT